MKNSSTQWHALRPAHLVNPRVLVVHIHKDPLLLGALLAALEGSLDVFIPALALQGKANPAEDGLGVSIRKESNNTRKGWYSEECPASTHIALRNY
jgi:hypothetical protein